MHATSVYSFGPATHGAGAVEAMLMTCHMTQWLLMAAVMTVGT